MTSPWLISGWAVELKGEVYCSVLMAARDIFQLSIERYEIKHLVHDPTAEVIVKWIS
jgi:hypothetical protein